MSGHGREFTVRSAGAGVGNDDTDDEVTELREAVDLLTEKVEELAEDMDEDVDLDTDGTTNACRCGHHSHKPRGGSDEDLTGYVANTGVMDNLDDEGETSTESTRSVEDGDLTGYVERSGAFNQLDSREG
jgi:CDGSH-type Zn-finger protein